MHVEDIHREAKAITPSRARVYVYTALGNGFLCLPVKEFNRVGGKVPDDLPVLKPPFFMIRYLVMRGDFKFAWKMFLERFGVATIGN